MGTFFQIEFLFQFKHINPIIIFFQIEFLFQVKPIDLLETVF
jgi:hypothetical protein